MNKVLIVDDEAKIRKLLSRILSVEGFEVCQADGCNEAKRILSKEADVAVVFCDVKMPDGNGVDLVLEIKKAYPHVEVILLTAYGNIPDGIQAIKNGAYDYLIKGDDNSRIIPLLNEALARVSEKKSQQPTKTILHNSLTPKSAIVCHSPVIKTCYDMALKVARASTSVLLTGQTGTGKEVFARFIHHNSLRSDQPFVAINCAAFSKDMLEGELFGHRVGAFTGAIRDQKGLIEEADNGTLFLDEIGEMPLDLQPKILRVLESGEYIRIGDTVPKKVNIRIISATNRDLSQEVEMHRFREDLFYRISVFQIKLPALSQRKEDIPELVKTFVAQFSGQKDFSIEQKAMDALVSYTWPGNIRELKNVVERSLILADGNELKMQDLPYELQKNGSRIATDQEPKTFSMTEIEKAHIKKVLLHTSGNKSEAAKLLGIGLATLYRKIEEYQL